MYFSWYPSSFLLSKGVYVIIKSINISRSPENLGDLGMECLTIPSALSQTTCKETVKPLNLGDILIWFSICFETNLNAMTDYWGISCEITLRWMSLNFTDHKSTLAQMMAWIVRREAIAPSQFRPRSMSPYGGTRPRFKLPLDERRRTLLIVSHHWLRIGNKPLPETKLIYFIENIVVWSNENETHLHSDPLYYFPVCSRFSAGVML